MKGGGWVPKAKYFGPLPEKPAEFDWSDTDSDAVVLAKQLAIAIYFNKADDLVIRQEADWNEDDDTVVIVSKCNIEAFLDRLTDACGIPSAP